MASIRRKATLLTLSLLALHGGLRTVEARQLRLRGSVHRVPPRETGSSPRAIAVAPTIEPGGHDASALPPTTTGAVDRLVTVGQRPIADGPTSSAGTISASGAAPVARAAEPWCRSGRISGSGEGFCLIN